MDTQILSSTGVGVELAELIGPFAIALIALVITLMFKDYATGIAKGLRFRMRCIARRLLLALCSKRTYFILKT